MKKKRKLLLFIIIFNCVTYNLFANIYELETSFININRIKVIKVNPAVISDIKNIECSVEFIKPAIGLSEGSIDMFNGGVTIPYIPLKNGKTIGICGDYLRAGIGENLPYFINYNINIIYGYRINDIFSIGIESKINGWKLENYTLDNAIEGNSYDFDIGSKINIEENTTFGIIVKNIMQNRNDSGIIDEGGENRNSRGLDIGVNYTIMYDNIILGLKYIIKNEKETGFVCGVEKRTYKNDFRFKGELTYLNNLIFTGEIGIKLYKFEINYTISYSLSLHYNGGHRIGINFKY